MTAQLWFFIIISLVIFNYLFSNLLDYINHRNLKDEIPNESILYFVRLIPIISADK